MALNNELQSIANVFNAATSKPEQFVAYHEKNHSIFTNLTKQLFELCKQNEPEDIQTGPLKELTIENFDDEQIWQQIELHNTPALQVHLKRVAKVLAAGKRLKLVGHASKNTFNDDVSEDEHITGEDEDVSEGGDITGEDEEELESINEEDEEFIDSEEELLDNKLKELQEVEHDDEDELDFDIVEASTSTRKSKKKNLKQQMKIKVTPSIVDDQFFKLSQMEKFLEIEDAKEARKHKIEDDEEDDSEDVDYWEDIPSDDEDEEGSLDLDNEPNIQSARELHYKDYFKDDENGDEDEKEGEEDEEDELEEEEEEEENWGTNLEDEDETEIYFKQNRKKTVKNDDEDDDSDGEDIKDILGSSKEDKGLSGHERRQQKLRQKIAEVEKANLSEKPWQMSGETTALKRPENSLLAEDIQFDVTTNPAPIITEETTQTLEELITQRIKDKAWDDVERKVKPKEEAYEFKKRVTLDQEKSKSSLSAIYEEEYLKQTREKKEEENKEHVEIRKMMQSLFVKLDALSNFHYIPKPPLPEIKIVHNIPSISLEDVAPVTVNDSDLLAPEELKMKVGSGEIKSKEEMSETDKKRSRRKKKLRQHIKALSKQKRLQEKINAGKVDQLSQKASMEELQKKAKGFSKTTKIVKDKSGNKSSN
ncbi:U3 small nucleolar ribonucleoprotein protein MPP10-like isoform X2 [Antedon mediterranea]|uniref:U3 small nucleolar ribonucleoprotein protein MPP10-like isoform X2 n=1 Tax=Antedon mediterranea TaxID=105859 RepID=UPI003AF81EDA